MILQDKTTTPYISKKAVSSETAFFMYSNTTLMKVCLLHFFKLIDSFP